MLGRLCFVSSLLSLAAVCLAQDPTPQDRAMAEQLMQQRGGGGRFFGRGANQVTISPDGTQITWVGGPLEGRGQSGIWTMPLAGGEPTRIAAPGRGVTFSPDRTMLMATSGGDGKTSIQLTPTTGGEEKTIYSFTGQIGQPVWSPDGKSIAFLGIENPKRVSGATQPFKPETGLVGSKPDVQRLAIVDVASGEMHWASPADMYVYEFGWSPDSREIAVTAARPPGENNWWTAKLYAADATTGKLRLVATPDLQINEPRWSPDGQTIAYIGGLMSDFGSIGGDIYTVPAGGGKPTDATPGIKGSPNVISWQPDGAILFGETVEGEGAYCRLDVHTGKIQPLVHAANVSSVSLSRDGKTVAYVSGTLTHGSELFAGPVGAPKQLSHWSNDTVPNWGLIKSIHWKSGGFDVQGWLVAPANMEPGKKYPMIVQVHGGPAAAVTGGLFLGQGASFWSQAGYYVFEPNPRGSYGEGEEFTKANRKDFGYGDFRDIMAGVDKVIATEPVDGDRLALTGGSYGGYMSMWGVTQTNRFKACIAVAGIANWQSYYGENSIDQWMIPFFGATVYDDPKVYAKCSPITFIKNVKTPTMVVVGEFDGECPPPQSYEFWHALNVLGVKTELLVYPGEGHGIRQPENRTDLQIRELAWFNYYLKR